MQNKLFLPIEPDGSLNIPPALVKHLGLPTDELVGITIPSKTSCCLKCEELELRLTACCDENLCNGYTTHDDSINLPQELLDIADIPAGAELYAVCSDGNLMFIIEELDSYLQKDWTVRWVENIFQQLTSPDKEKIPPIKSVRIWSLQDNVDSRYKFIPYQTFVEIGGGALALDDYTTVFDNTFPSNDLDEIYTSFQLGKVESYQLTTIESIPNLAFLGFGKGENRYTYPAPTLRQCEELLANCSSMADYLLVDTSSNFTRDLLSATALLASHCVVRLETLDIKNISYLSSNLALLIDHAKFRAEKQIRVLNDIYDMPWDVSKQKKGYELPLPHCPELGLQSRLGNLLNTLKEKDSKPYQKSIKKLTELIIRRGGN